MDRHDGDAEALGGNDLSQNTLQLMTLIDDLLKLGALGEQTGKLEEEQLSVGLESTMNLEGGEERTHSGKRDVDKGGLGGVAERLTERRRVEPQLDEVHRVLASAHRQLASIHGEIIDVG